MTAEEKWARLTLQFHDTKEGIPFGDACRCGGTVHRWGARLDNWRCPDRNTKKHQAKLKALGEALNG